MPGLHLNILATEKMLQFGAKSSRRPPAQEVKYLDFRGKVTRESLSKKYSSKYFNNANCWTLTVVRLSLGLGPDEQKSDQRAKSLWHRRSRGTKEERRELSQSNKRGRGDNREVDRITQQSAKGRTAALTRSSRMNLARGHVRGRAERSSTTVETEHVEWARIIRDRKSPRESYRWPFAGSRTTRQSNSKASFHEKSRRVAAESLNNPICSSSSLPRLLSPAFRRRRGVGISSGRNLPFGSQYHYRATKGIGRRPREGNLLCMDATSLLVRGSRKTAFKSLCPVWANSFPRPVTRWFLTMFHLYHPDAWFQRVRWFEECEKIHFDWSSRRDVMICKISNRTYQLLRVQF